MYIISTLISTNIYNLNQTNVFTKLKRNNLRLRSVFEEDDNHSTLIGTHRSTIKQKGIKIVCGWGPGRRGTDKKVGVLLYSSCTPNEGDVKKNKKGFYRLSRLCLSFIMKSGNYCK